METQKPYGFTPSKDTFIDKLIVHAGAFHADDVMCAVIAKTINPDVKIERTYKVTPDMEAPGVLIADIGMGMYDHHQNDAELRPDGHKHAAIGLMMKDDRIREKFLEKIHDISQGREPQVLSQLMEEIAKIEDIDNGNVDKEATHIITEYAGYSNPVWDSDKSWDDAFSECVDEVKSLWLDTMVQGQDYRNTPQNAKMAALLDQKKEIYEAAGKRCAHIMDKVLNNMEDHVAILPQGMPWAEYLVPSEAEFVIFPSNRGGYALQCVPPELGSFEKKVELPDWSQNKPEGCIFAHMGRFFASFDTLENAVRAAKNIERGKTMETSHKTSLDERLKIAKKQCEESKKTKPSTHNDGNRGQDRGEREER